MPRRRNPDPMSIALSIQPRGLGPEAARMIPIATQEAFRNDWLPACKELGLTWVPMFEAGVPVAHEDISDVLVELRSLASWSATHRLDAESSIAERLQRLVTELESAKEQPNVDIFIG